MAQQQGTSQSVSLQQLQMPTGPLQMWGTVSSGGFFPTEKSSANELFVNLGAALESNRAASKIQAIVNPADFIERRNTEIYKLFYAGYTKGAKMPDEIPQGQMGTVARHYWDVYNRLISDGVPKLSANKLATDQSQKLFENEVALMDLVKFPSLVSTTFDAARAVESGTAKIAELALK